MVVRSVVARQYQFNTSARISNCSLHMSCLCYIWHYLRSFSLLFLFFLRMMINDD